MDYATAKAIVNEVAPELLVDDEDNNMPNVLHVRKTKDGAPHCIMIGTPPTTNLNLPAEERAARERKLLTDALAGAREVMS